MTAYTATFIVLLCLCFLATGLLYSHSHPSQQKISATQDMAIDAIFIALILIMSFVPNMGYITVAPGISLTLIHIPVLIGACLRGVKKGTLYGLVFGVSSWLEALIIGTGFNLFLFIPGPRSHAGSYSAFFPASSFLLEGSSPNDTPKAYT
jgi:hypothetical protein